ncbi:MAG: CDP-glycerol glycerophosphotransferase family protein [Bacilli bacterium]|nr:CDP-glycerol glycerophosphotransferase family protein [Bacilli bacterium]
MKNKLKSLIIKLNLLSAISIIYYIFRIFKIKNNKVFCQNFTSGKGIGDSPKYIALELLKDKEKEYDIVWAVSNPKKIKDIPNGIRLVKIYSIKYFYEMSTAKVWISNTRFELFTKKRKKQFYIQTWHSPLRLKKIENDAAEYLSDYYKKCMKNDSKMIDVIFSGCKFSTNIYKRAFLYNGKILEIGTPRCDVFFDKNLMNQAKNKIKKQYDLDNKKIILYAPTFRKHNTNNDYLMDFKYICSNLKNDYNVLVRSHPSEKISLDENGEFIDVSSYPDIQDLICCADFLITDYSSCSFDMLIANKPCILLVKDLNEYLKKERALYFKFEELPFVKCKTDEELLKVLSNFNVDEYYRATKNFKSKIGMKENGTASKKAKELIDKQCWNKKGKKI